VIITNIIGKPSAKSPVLVASLPDMGDVGGIAPRYLVTRLRAKKFAEITTLEKPWVQYRGGVVNAPKVNYSLYYHNSSDLIVFTGQSQPEYPATLFDLCEAVLQIAGSLAPLRRVYAIGGSDGGNAQLVSSVYACTSTEELLDELKKYKVPLLEEREGAITWFNGVILGVAAARGVQAIGVYGKVDDPKVPQPLAVRNVLGLLITMRAIPKIDLSELEEEHKRIQERLRGEQSKEQNDNVS
jgi:proteasome assembly chaperone (PAC2) family protein